MRSVVLALFAFLLLAAPVGAQAAIEYGSVRIQMNGLIYNCYYLMEPLDLTRHQVIVPPQDLERVTRAGILSCVHSRNTNGRLTLLGFYCDINELDGNRTWRFLCTDGYGAYWRWERNITT